MPDNYIRLDLPSALRYKFAPSTSPESDFLRMSIVKQLFTFIYFLVDFCIIIVKFLILLYEKNKKVEIGRARAREAEL